MLVIKGFNDKKERLLKCKVCGNKYEKIGMIEIRDLGYICYGCRDDEGSYSSENGVRVGKGSITYSIEFETSERDVDLHLLRKYGYIPTYDGSIGGLEWKSPIYKGKGVLVRHLKVLDKFTYAIDDHCGTHLHVGTLSLGEKSFIYDYYDDLFKEVTDYLIDNRYKTEIFFGRYFTPYATKGISRHHRYSWVNISTSQPTIEFRLPVFTSKNQYKKVVDFATDVVRLLKKEYQKYISSDYYSDDARKAGKRIIKILEKYL